MSDTSGRGDLETRLAKLLGSYDARPDTSGVRFALASSRRGWDWEWASPGSVEPYFIASTTKLFVTALIMQLRSEGRLDLDAPAARFLEPSIMAGIHVLRGVDYRAEQLVVRVGVEGLPPGCRAAGIVYPDTSPQLESALRALRDCGVDVTV